MRTTTRPPRTFETGPGTRVLRLATWAGAVALLGVGALVALRATGPVPVHVDATGTPDRYGSPAEALVATAVLVGCVALCLALSHVPQVYNYPVAFPEARAQAVYREGERVMVWTAAACLVLGVGATSVTLGGGGALDALLWVGLALVALVLVVGVARMVRAARPGD